MSKDTKNKPKFETQRVPEAEAVGRGKNDVDTAAGAPNEADTAAGAKNEADTSAGAPNEIDTAEAAPTEIDELMIEEAEDEDIDFDDENFEVIDFEDDDVDASEDEGDGEARGNGRANGRANGKANSFGSGGKEGYRAGFVALVGQPNAGKSTLLNMLLNEKVSIVSNKPQTTRTRVTGILTMDEAQIVFVDSPGRLKSTSGINKFLQEEVADVMDNADVIVALLAADDEQEPVKDLLSQLRAGKKPWVVLITKSDVMGGTRTPKYFQYLIDEQIPFVSISTLKRPKEAREELLSRIVPLLPKSGYPLYDEDLYTTQTIRQMAAELVREACFENLRQEIPYGLAVKVVEFKEDENIPRIRAEIVVERPNHRAIVLGKGGTTIKKIGMEARKQIERVVGGQVFLQLHVNVKENWTKNPRILKELGYVVQKD